MRHEIYIPDGWSACTPKSKTLDVVQLSPDTPMDLLAKLASKHSGLDVNKAVSWWHERRIVSNGRCTYVNGVNELAIWLVRPLHFILNGYSLAPIKDTTCPIDFDLAAKVIPDDAITTLHLIPYKCRYIRLSNDADVLNHYKNGKTYTLKGVLNADGTLCSDYENMIWVEGNFRSFRPLDDTMFARMFDAEILPNNPYIGHLAHVRA